MRLKYRIIEFFRYGIVRFVKNVWNFRKELYEFYAWDSTYQLSMLGRGLELNADYLETYGNEIESSRSKKVKMMRRATTILKWHTEDLFMELAEKEMGHKYDVGDIGWEEDGGETYNDISGKFEKLYRMVSNLPPEKEEINTLLLNRSREIEKDSWNELFDILKGQNVDEFKSDNENSWDEWFDGSGMKYWWD